MASSSDGSYSEMDVMDDGTWKKVRHKRKSKHELDNKSKKNKALSKQEIEHINKGTTNTNIKPTKTTKTKTTDNHNPTETINPS